MGNVVLVMGLNGAGKTTLAQKLYPTYKRLNRDEVGGSLSQMADRLSDVIANGDNNVVLDNTFLTRESRRAVLQTAKNVGCKVEVVWLKTTLEDAQVNACLRMLERYGRLIDEQEGKTLSKNDPNLFPNIVLYKSVKELQPPELKEGIDKISEVPFVRTWGPEYVNEAIIFDYDDTLRELPPGHKGAKYPTHPDHVMIMKKRVATLEEIRGNEPNTPFLGASNQSGVAKGIITKEEAEACFKRTNELLGFDIDVLYCPHPSGPPKCYCRKPHPGLLVHHIWKYKLKPEGCVFVGDQTTDKTVAKRVGMPFQYASDFFA